MLTSIFENKKSIKRNAIIKKEKKLILSKNNLIKHYYVFYDFTAVKTNY